MKSTSNQNQVAYEQDLRKGMIQTPQRSTSPISKSQSYEHGNQNLSDQTQKINSSKKQIQEMGIESSGGEADDDGYATDQNSDDCYKCGDVGKLFCCENCYRALHVGGICDTYGQEIEKDIWLCSFCLNLRNSKKNECVQCDQSFGALQEHKKITCAKCLRKMHESCVETPLILILDAPLNKYFVFDRNTLKDINQGSFQSASSLYSKHKFQNLFHICNSCQNQLEFREIYGVRSIESYRRPFYLAQLNRSSDVHKFWVSLDSSKHDFLKERLFQLPEYKDPKDEPSYRIEKIVACTKSVNNKKKSHSQTMQELLGANSEPRPASDHYYFLVKWEDREYNRLTWENEFLVGKFPDKILVYFTQRITNEKRKSIPPSLSLQPDQIPSFEEKGLYDHQIQGCRWLINQYILGKSSILADQSGLGKKIQTLCFLKFLRANEITYGPFLIVVPEGKLKTWDSMMKKWCPDLDMVQYEGREESRKTIMDVEFFSKSLEEDRPRFNLLLVSYERINTSPEIEAIKWDVVIFDETQNTRKSKERTQEIYNRMTNKFKLLLTGNSIRSSIEDQLFFLKCTNTSPEEVIALSRKFRRDQAAFAQDFKSKEKLKNLLDDVILRRTIDETNLKFIEPQEMIIKLDLTPAQKSSCKSLLEKHYLQGKPPPPHRTKFLRNMLRSLQLVCDHPDLLNMTKGSYGKELFEKLIIDKSNKLIFILQMVQKLWSKGHRILIFTQFPSMLDLIEESLDFRHLLYERLDETTRNESRQSILEGFYLKKFPCLILSTRVDVACINFGFVDSVIFVESAFNSYYDMREFYRSCRVVQKSKKLIAYRLASQPTVESEILEKLQRNGRMEEVTIEKESNHSLEECIENGILSFQTKTHDSNFEDTINHNLEEIIKKSSGGFEAKKKGEWSFLEFELTSSSLSRRNSLQIEELGKEGKKGDSEIINIEEKDLKDIEIEIRFEISSVEDDDLEVIWAEEHHIEKIRNGIEEKNPQEEEKANIQEEAASIPRKEREKLTPPYDHDEEKENRIQIRFDLSEELEKFSEKLVDFYQGLKDKNLEELEAIYPIRDIIRFKFVEFILKHGVQSSSLGDIIKQFWEFLTRTMSSEIKKTDLSRVGKFINSFLICLFNGPSLTPVLSEFFFANVQTCLIRKRILEFLCLRAKLESCQGREQNFNILHNEYIGTLQKNGLQAQITNTSWNHCDDYFLLSGINHYGLDAWNKVIVNKDLWIRSNSPFVQYKEAWKVLFVKIEQDEPNSLEEKQCLEFLAHYLKLRTSMLMDLLVKERLKSKKLLKS